MHRNTVDWAGYIPAITTPFTRSGALDWAALDAQLQWYLQERMHGVVLAGTAGEWFSLSAAERAELFAQAGRMIAGRITVLGGCNAYTPAHAIRHPPPPPPRAHPRARRLQSLPGGRGHRPRARGGARRARWHLADAAALHRAEPARVGAVLHRRVRCHRHSDLHLQLAARL